MLKLFFRADGGAILPIFALSLIPIISTAGLALDLSRANTARTVLQNEVDSAVLSGIAKNDKAAAIARFASFAPENFTITESEFELVDGVMTGSARGKVKTTMMKMLHISEVKIGVKSGAARAQSAGVASPVCILVKDPMANQALLVNSGVTINAPGCEMHVRSSVSGAAMINNGGNINLKKTCIKSTSITENGTKIPSLEKGCATIDDPFAGKLPAVTLPTNSCATQNRNYDANPKTLTLAGGNYCNINFNSGFDKVTIGAGNLKGVNFSGIKELNLGPGLYENINFNSGINQINLSPGLYIWKASTNLNSGIKIVGTDVTFYYPDQNSYIQVNSGATINLKAPTAGAYSGILFFEKDGLSVGNGFSINGNADHRLEGLIYWPSRNVTFNSTSNITGDKITLVVNKIILNNINWTFTAADYGMGNPSTPVPVASMPRLMK